MLLILLAFFGLATAATADQRFEFSPFQIPESGRIVVPVVEGDALRGVAARPSSARLWTKTRSGRTSTLQGSITWKRTGRRFLQVIQDGV